MSQKSVRLLWIACILLATVTLFITAADAQWFRNPFMPRQRTDSWFSWFSGNRNSNYNYQNNRYNSNNSYQSNPYNSNYYSQNSYNSNYNPQNSYNSNYNSQPAPQPSDYELYQRSRYQSGDFDSTGSQTLLMLTVVSVALYFITKYFLNYRASSDGPPLTAEEQNLHRDRYGAPAGSVGGGNHANSSNVDAATIWSGEFEGEALSRQMSDDEVRNGDWVRVSLIWHERNKTFVIKKTETVQYVKDKFFGPLIASGRRVMLIYRGQVMRDAWPLSSYLQSIADDAAAMVCHCNVTIAANEASSSHSPHVSGEPGWLTNSYSDISSYASTHPGSILATMLCSMLLFFWILLSTYGSLLFDTFSTVILTILSIVAIYVMSQIFQNFQQHVQTQAHARYEQFQSHRPAPNAGGNNSESAGERVNYLRPEQLREELRRQRQSAYGASS